MTDPAANCFELFWGDASAAQTRVYARWTQPGEPGMRLAGTLHGPHCQYGQTLPARYTFQDRGWQPEPLAECVVPDACFWSPDSPQLYRADLELTRNGLPMAACRRWLAIRPLGLSGSWLRWENKAWVPRLISRSLDPQAPLAAWRELAAVMVVEQYEPELFDDAARVGVPLAARIAQSEAEQPALMARWASCPAVILLIVDPGVEPVAASVAVGSPSRFAPRLANLLWAQPAPSPAAAVPPGIDFWSLAAPQPAGSALGRGGNELLQPGIARHPISPRATLHEARRACDRLQATLAKGYPPGQWAGYWIDALPVRGNS